MTEGEDFIKNAKSTHGHRSAMSNSTWCDLNKNCTVLKLHDMCHNPKCKRQKQITFTPKQFQLEGNGFQKTMKKIIQGSQTAWNKFSKPTINKLAPVIGTAVGAKSKNKQVGQATTNILKSKSRGKILSLTVMHGNGLRLKVMRNHFKESSVLKMNEFKKCSKCEMDCLKSNFHERLGSKDGLKSICKNCVKKYYLDDYDKIIQKTKDWNQKKS